MLTKIDFWNSVCRNAEGEGGGAGSDSSGVAADAGATEGLAGSEPVAPSSTFLSEVAKTAGETTVPPEGEKKEGEAAAEPKAEGDAPAAFDIASVKLPEGLELSEELGKSFAEALSDEKLSPQERGQRLLDLHAETVKTLVPQLTEQVKAENVKLWTQTNDAWRAEIRELPEFKADPEGEGGKVIQALVAVGAKEDFFKALDLTGAGNNPAILQILHRLTKPFIEGGAVSGGAGAKAPRQLGANIYNSTKP